MHVDDFIDRFDTGEQTAEVKYARWFFFLHRLAAVHKMEWHEQISQYKLYCDYGGRYWRVVGCSRMGDVWLTSKLDDEQYELRVNLDECSNWSKERRT
jgi:hypothetical protein